MSHFFHLSFQKEPELFKGIKKNKKTKALKKKQKTSSQWIPRVASNAPRDICRYPSLQHWWQVTLWKTSAIQKTGTSPLGSFTKTQEVLNGRTLPPPPKNPLLFYSHWHFFTASKEEDEGGENRETEVTVQKGEQPIRDTLEFSEITNFLGLMETNKLRNMARWTADVRQRKSGSCLRGEFVGTVRRTATRWGDWEENHSEANSKHQGISRRQAAPKPGRPRTELADTVKNYAEQIKRWLITAAPFPPPPRVASSGTPGCFWRSSSVSLCSWYSHLLQNWLIISPTSALVQLCLLNGASASNCGDPGTDFVGSAEHEISNLNRCVPRVESNTLQTASSQWHRGFSPPSRLPLRSSFTRSSSRVSPLLAQ